MKPLPILPLALSCFLFQQAPPAPPRSPADLPAHDRHEGLVIAADPCLDAARSKALFGKKNPYEAGILALDVFIKNETPQPMRINLSTVRLEVPLPDGGSQKLESLQPREVATLVVYPAGAPNPSSGRRLPGGIVVSSARQESRSGFRGNPATGARCRHRAAACDDSWLSFFQPEPQFQAGRRFDALCPGYQSDSRQQAFDVL